MVSPPIQYHISILKVLARCNLGPKLNAIYPVKDLLYAILDSSTVFPVKRAMGYLLLEIMKTQAGIEKAERQIIDGLILIFVFSFLLLIDASISGAFWSNLQFLWSM